MADEAWSSLEDAYGDATRLGLLLRLLSDADRAVASDAALELQDRLAHSGAITEATPPGVVAILTGFRADAWSWVAEALAVLLGIAHSMGTWRDASARSQVPAAYENECEWETQCRDALRSGLSVYRELMGADDPEVASVAAYLLGYCDPSPEEIGVHLINMAGQLRDERAVACFVGAAVVAWRRSSLSSEAIRARVVARMDVSSCMEFRISDALGDTSEVGSARHLVPPPDCLWPTDL